MFCKNCGSRINENARFCGECGTKISEETKTATKSISMNQEVQATTIKNTSKKKPNLVIIVVALIATILIGYFIFKEPSETRRTPEQTISQYYEALAKESAKDVWELYSLSLKSSYASVDDSRFVEDVLWESDWYNDRYGNNWKSNITIKVVEINENSSTVRVDFPDDWVDFFDLVKENGVWKIVYYYYN
jgi:hypothetical protein